MLNFFRKNKKPPQANWIMISGNCYTRQGIDIAVLRYKTQKFETCQPDHVAPNGLTIQQIAYAIAIIDGLINIAAAMPASSMPPLYRGRESTDEV
jgi:hypothetical protein